MIIKTLSLGFAALITLAAAPAFAAPPAAPGHQAEVKHALEALSLDLGAERVTVNRFGTKDVTYFTAMSHDAVVADLKAAHESGRVLPNGLRVSGWSFIHPTQSYTVTLKNEKTRDNYLVEIMKDAQGARLLVSGNVLAFRPKRAPLSQIPRRYSNVERPSVTR